MKMRMLETLLLDACVLFIAPPITIVMATIQEQAVMVQLGGNSDGRRAMPLEVDSVHLDPQEWASE